MIDLSTKHEEKFIFTASQRGRSKKTISATGSLMQLVKEVVKNEVDCSNLSVGLVRLRLEALRADPSDHSPAGSWVVPTSC